MLEPSLARRHDLPHVEDQDPEAAAWNAVLEHCRTAEGEPTTASVVQFFADTPHAGMLAAVLALAADQALPADQVEVQVLAAAEKLRSAEDRRAVSVMLSQPLSALSATEREALAERLKTSRNAGPRTR